MSDTFNADPYLFAAYVLCLVACCVLAGKNHNGHKGLALVSLLGASVTFMAAEALIFFDVAKCFFHLGIALICARWAIFTIKACEAGIVAFFIACMGLFQVILSVDATVYPYLVTHLGGKYAEFCLIFHLMILVATMTNGFTIRIMPKRYDNSAGTNL